MSWDFTIDHMIKCPLAGTLDLVFPKYNAFILVYGRFLDRYNCKQITNPATQKKFLLAKYEDNVPRDRKNNQMLQDKGWHVGSI
ncbi:very short patch repair endonuclease [Legionella pneumophila]|uniref:very short patch repair endonuclease n=1 Tax=Legionella pneumophila TaxID=446 RepID=UPI001F1FF217|nr:very short patch repair endonuclease [Legionella pneumophila]